MAEPALQNTGPAPVLDLTQERDVIVERINNAVKSGNLTPEAGQRLMQRLDDRMNSLQKPVLEQPVSAAPTPRAPVKETQPVSAKEEVVRAPATDPMSAFDDDYNASQPAPEKTAKSQTELANQTYAEEIAANREAPVSASKPFMQDHASSLSNVIDFQPGQNRAKEKLTPERIAELKNSTPVSANDNQRTEQTPDGPQEIRPVSARNFDKTANMSERHVGAPYNDIYETRADVNKTDETAARQDNAPDERLMPDGKGGQKPVSASNFDFKHFIRSILSSHPDTRNMSASDAFFAGAQGMERHLTAEKQAEAAANAKAVEDRFKLNAENRADRRLDLDIRKQEFQELQGVADTEYTIAKTDQLKMKTMRVINGNSLTAGLTDGQKRELSEFMTDEYFRLLELRDGLAVGGSADVLQKRLQTMSDEEIFNLAVERYQQSVDAIAERELGAM